MRAADAAAWRYTLTTLGQAHPAMLNLEQITKGAAVAGLEPDEAVHVVTVEHHGPDSLTVYYRRSNGELRERLVYRNEEAQLSLAQEGRPWSFDADPEEFKLAVEAYRINLAYLFDPMMAVHTSSVEPLPHQITAVYEAMLPRQPLRYVLADDPGAGKTIMAGLFIRELVMRADAKRVLIVAPGSLVDQWQDELAGKFGLDFEIFGRDLAERARTGNPFNEYDFLIARLDQLSRSDELLEKLRQSEWDLVVVDEAHKLSAGWYGNEIKETKRFKLGKDLGLIGRHFLLMTATPHNGKEEDFQLFLSLLDGDRFYGRFRDGAKKVDISDLMRRMVKEELVKFDGKPLFPERKAYTVNYKLSDLEAALYEAVTSYVRNEMNRADRLVDGKQRGTVGFAMTSLQRRLASSPEAIYQSLKRRKERLKRRIEEERLRQRGEALAEVLDGTEGIDLWSADEDLPADEFEEVEEEVVDKASAARTIQELEAEVLILADLEGKARAVVNSGLDSKWRQLSELLQTRAEMMEAPGKRRKLIVFTEHRDTLNYLTARLRDVLGSTEAVVNIHGGTKREDRRAVQELFRNDPRVLMLVATDAAGEGVNLQNANLMVNYDLPWNPNRIEQRFGRIHRIGQTEVCHLWNLVASETREGDVFQKLFDKLEVERKALGGRVFDILGEVFEGTPLRDLLMEAIRFGDDPVRRAEYERKFSAVLDSGHIQEVLSRNALATETMAPERLFRVREQMERAEARKLQPYFIRSFFVAAFERLGGRMNPRESGRFEISYVPGIVRERDRLLSGRDRARREPVVERYERICFEKTQIDVPGRPKATLVHPGHPLMQAVVDLMLERHRATLKRGTILVDPNDPGTEPRVVFLIDHAVREAAGSDPDRAVSRRAQFVAMAGDGSAHNAGWAPHLDLERLDPAEIARTSDVVESPWIQRELEATAVSYASSHLAQEHYDEVRHCREDWVDKTLAAVHERLSSEIRFQEHKYEQLKQDRAAGKDVRLNLENTRRLLDTLSARLQFRTAELRSARTVANSTPVVLGGALVIPQGLIDQRRGVPAPSVDAVARSAVERIAMDAVRKAEEALGHTVIDVSADKCGWDLTAIPPIRNGQAQTVRHIEVKGRAKGQSTITVTRNEVCYGLNQADKFVLAIVLVDGATVEGPHYVRRPFEREPDWAAAAVNYDLAALLARASPPTP